MPRFVLTALIAIALPLLAAPAETRADANPSASGHSTIVRLGEKQTFSFNAVRHQDGRTTGQMQANVRYLDRTYHAALDCLRFLSPTEAVLSGVLTKSNDPSFPVGTTILFQVQDNGEGPDAPPDMLSPITFPPTKDCTNETNPLLVDIEKGNIQVRAP